MITLRVSDFGPIIEGTVNLKPLTIFIGPNNSGKSYFAVLTYALFRPSSPRMVRRFGFPRLLHFSRMEDSFLAKLFDKDVIIKSWRDLFRAYIDMAKDTTLSIPFENLPGKLKQVLQESLHRSANELVIAFGSELERCYGAKLFELRRKESKRGFNILISQTTPPLLLNTSFDEENFRLVESQLDVSKQSITFGALRKIRFGDLAKGIPFSLFKSAHDFFTQVFKGFLVDPYYFPAARSGILQSHKALASYVVGYSPLAGIEKLPEIPRLPGVVADFISELLRLEKDKRTKLYDIATFLEDEVTRGTIDIEAGKLEYPEIYYKPESGEFPLHTTSSMVSELAPLVLFLKYLVEPNDLVIIEEPESHLHPQSQLKLATGIAKLVRAGVTILITTHSDYFVQQLSNFVRLSQIPEEQRVKQGYSPNDYITPDEVGAYLFDLDEKRGGSIVKELAVTPRDGISEEEFAKVTEALYKETVYLDRAVSAR